jgi:glutamine amidotransferase
MLAVIDYGAGNLQSVLHALHHLNAEQIQLVRTPEDLKGATKVILPGVGAFGQGMAQLRQQDLISPLIDTIQAGIPYLGICLGMQFLFEQSDEMGTHAGLGIIKGHVQRFAPHPRLKVPHMGWNQVIVNKSSALLDGINDGDYFYFVHSYYCIPSDPADQLLATDYGTQFTSAVQHDNVYGVQFHPEKSQQVGLTILSNFLRLAESE